MAATEGEGLTQAAFRATCLPPAHHWLSSCCHSKSRIWVCAPFFLFVPGWLVGLLFFFLQLQGQTLHMSCLLRCTKAGCLKGNSSCSGRHSARRAGLRGGRGTFTHPFSQSCRSPSLSIKSYFLHSMHEARPRQYIRYCG